jgi:pimeloyl-ACP methyl ester carboxylesterase
MRRSFLLIAAGVLASHAVCAQRSVVTPWSNEDPNNPSPAYRTEPILFVHGINSNDEGWQQAIAALATPMASYQRPVTLPPQTVGGSVVTRAAQTNYLHTFNYGDPRASNALNRTSFDHIEWNAWEADMRTRLFTNVFVQAGSTGYLQPAPNDNRQTLDRRILNIRIAYTADPANTNSAPNVVLVTHSMGGLLAHYYLIRSAPNTGVRRVVTLAAPHLGSHVANWVMWDRNAGIGSHILDGMRSLFIIPALRRTANLVQQIPGTPFRPTAGYYRYGQNGATEDISVNNPTAPNHLRHHNDLIDFFWANPAPKIEYVFNAYCSYPNFSGYQAEQVVTHDVRLASEQRDGDGVVAPWSAAGKLSGVTTSIWNGASNPSGMHDVDPVVFGVWSNTDHSAAVGHTNSQLLSLDGVRYRWPTSDPQDYGRMYGENQSFSKYFSSPGTGSVAYTDEPGIADLKLLADRSGNGLLIPAFDTYTTNSSGWVKSHTNAADFVNHQIIGGSGVRYLGTAGAKNRSQNPVATSGTNYWVVAGNEYLPASLSLQVSSSNAPMAVATNTASLPGATSGMVTSCLVQLDTNGDPQFQYGYFESSTGGSVAIGSNQYVAAQGYNLAKLLTPQVERAFNAPVDSTTLVTVLTKINQGEILSNQCHNATNPTRWTAMVSEWVNVPSDGVVTLNFFPTSNPPFVFDAWTDEDFSGYDYEETNKTLIVTNVTDAPSQLIISDEVYLGCARTFTNDYGGIVSNLTSSSLAGVPVNEDFVLLVRSRLEAILPKYKNQFIDLGCSNWTLSDIIRQADPAHSQTAWTAINDHLLLPQHFIELKNVAALLTTESVCCCACSSPALYTELFDAAADSEQTPTVFATKTVTLTAEQIRAGCRWYVVSATEDLSDCEQLGLIIDDTLGVNGHAIPVCQTRTCTCSGEPAEDCLVPVAPIEVTDFLVPGDNVFQAINSWGCQACTEVWLVTCLPQCRSCKRTWQSVWDAQECCGGQWTPPILVDTECVDPEDCTSSGWTKVSDCVARMTECLPRKCGGSAVCNANNPPAPPATLEGCEVADPLAPVAIASGSGYTCCHPPSNDPTALAECEITFNASTPMTKVNDCTWEAVIGSYEWKRWGQPTSGQCGVVTCTNIDGACVGTSLGIWRGELRLRLILEGGYGSLCLTWWNKPTVGTQFSQEFYGCNRLSDGTCSYYMTSAIATEGSNGEDCESVSCTGIGMTRDPVVCYDSGAHCHGAFEITVLLGR